MRNYSVVRLILAFLPIIQHFQDGAYYSKNYSSIISSGLMYTYMNSERELGIDYVRRAH